jgi:hypothetical protein
MDPDLGTKKKEKSYVSLGRITTSTLKNAKEIDIYGHINLSLALFVTMVALYIVDFVYLFQYKTEYLAWIFAFIMNIILPISWALEVMKYPTSTYKYYLTGCLMVGILLEFVALLITLMTNSIIQKRITDFEIKRRLEQSGDMKPGESKDTTYDKIVNTVSGIIAEVITVNHWFKDLYATQVLKYNGVYSKQIKKKESKTYKQAEKWAKDYMKKHDKC